LDLYGFLSYEEQEFFEILNDIHGVGPKAALELSVLGPLDKIKDRLLTGDEKIFAGIPGIGAKRASADYFEEHYRGLGYNVRREDEYSLPEEGKGFQHSFK
jgi:Holliday junction resolvasome RuvABC DNA-binding subunit